MRRLTRAAILLAFFVLLHLSAIGAARPNVVLVVADDLGYGDLACYGAPDVRTPNLDAMAREGVRFTHAYATAPMCSPSRAAILTGRYQQRFGFEFNPFATYDSNFGLPPSERTIGDELRAAGYKTGYVGKWHLGWHEPTHPLNRGFDEFFGFRGGRHLYIPDPQWPSAIQRNRERVDVPGYLTDVLTDEAVAFMARHRRDPFLLVVSYNAVHTPLEAPERHKQAYAHLPEPNRRTACAMIAALDDGVGKIRSYLKETEIDKDTLVIFLSDNGGSLNLKASSNGPLSGGKNDLLEGGIRVPMILQWNGKVPASENAQPVMTFDAFATAVAAAGAKIPPDRRIDGIDLLPFVMGADEAEPHESLFWRVGNEMAVRKGKWKLIKQKRQPAMLFDVLADLSESRDLAGRQPQVVRRLERDLRNWQAELAEPLWPDPDDPAVQKSRRIAQRQMREKMQAAGAATQRTAETEEDDLDPPGK